jgi:RecJ-like exonuclease
MIHGENPYGSESGRTLDVEPGMVVCPKCDGRGRRLNWGPGDHQCTDCDGAGVVKQCPRCEKEMPEERSVPFYDIHVCRQCELRLERMTPTERVEEQAR